MYLCLGNSMDRGAWQATVQKLTESDTTEQVKQQNIYIYPPPFQLPFNPFWGSEIRYCYLSP